MKKAHAHQFANHPTWPTHVYCTVCGFALPRGGLLAYALAHGASLGPSK